MNDKEQFSCIYDSSQEKKGGGVPSKSCCSDSHLFMWINSHSGLTWPCFLVLSSLFWKQVFGPHQLECNLCTVHFSCFVLPSFFGSTFSFFMWFSSVPAGGWLGSGGEGDWSDTASTCGCYLCKNPTDLLLLRGSFAVCQCHSLHSSSAQTEGHTHSLNSVFSPLFVSCW